MSVLLNIMDANIDNLKKLLERLNSAGFFGRLFGWGKIKALLVDAAQDLQKILEAILELPLLRSHNQRRNELEIELAQVKTELRELQQKNESLKSENIEMRQQEKIIRQEYSKAMTTLNSVQEKIQDDRNKEVTDKNNAEIERIKKLKAAWVDHQEEVRNRIKAICKLHTIEYLDRVPFKGEPDNTLRICDEFVIFDAKSPGGDALRNFSNYLKDQSERAKKYINQENVKKEIFFVVPSNTLDTLAKFVYHLADYTVFVISQDSLEPVIMCLQKIEGYEFAEKLSPEDRENICRVLGKFAHISKRRIQIDSFFIQQFMQLAYKCESELPPDILEKTIEFEKAEKLNPPTEKRAKQIDTREIEAISNKLKSEIGSQGIDVSDISTQINQLPLYGDEEHFNKGS